MLRDTSVTFTIAVDVKEGEDLDDVWFQAVEIFRNGGGDIVDHTIWDKAGDILERGQ